MKRQFWIPYAILFLGAIWFILMASGLLKSLASDVTRVVPTWAILSAVLATPALAVLCSFTSLLQLKWRLIALVLLLLCVPLLPVAFEAHPLLATIVGLALVIEAFTIPAINRRSASRHAQS